MESATDPYLPRPRHNGERVGVRINWIWMLPLFLGIATPFCAMPFCDGDINYYLTADDPGADHGDDYYWKREGWLFPMTQSHAEWPPLGVQAEFQLLPIGIALNIAIGIAMWYCIWIIAWGISPNLLTRFSSERDRTKRSTGVADRPF
jgi:hypothetical protein